MFIKWEFKCWFVCCIFYNLFVFDVIGSKVCEIGGDDIVIIGNMESCFW